MSATALLLSALAVISISSVHCWPPLCIPTHQKSVLYMLMVNNTLTLQTDIWWRSSKLSQVMFTKSAFHLIIEKFWITILLLQLHHDVALKLVILGEYCYHRNLEKSLILIPSS
jgi:hypothetical protein